jgi:hypothetical protein
VVPVPAGEPVVKSRQRVQAAADPPEHRSGVGGFPRQPSWQHQVGVQRHVRIERVLVGEDPVGGVSRGGQQAEPSRLARRVCVGVGEVAADQLQVPSEFC